MKTLEQHIEEVMDYFDFEKVHAYMESVNWVWSAEGGIPSKAALRKNVREQMRKLYNISKKDPRNSVCCCSGGFKITYCWGKDKEGLWDRFDIDFVLTDWSTSD